MVLGLAITDASQMGGRKTRPVGSPYFLIESNSVSGFRSIKRIDSVVAAAAFHSRAESAKSAIFLIQEAPW